MSEAPTPTQTAYAVPVGRSRIATASPAIETTMATPKTTVGPTFVKPSERPSAVAHTASKTPLRMRMTQGMTTPS